MKIIGITGTIGAGKGTLVDFLVAEEGFVHFSVRQFLIEELNKRGWPVDRPHMTSLANELRRDHSASYIVEQLFSQAQSTGKNCIIESVRAPGEVEALKAKGDFILIAVDAEPRTRYNRVVLRRSETDRISFEEFMASEQAEMHGTDPSQQNLSKCIGMADLVLNNDGTMDELIEQLKKKMHLLRQPE